MTTVETHNSYHQPLDTWTCPDERQTEYIYKPFQQQYFNQMRKPLDRNLPKDPYCGRKRTCDRALIDPLGYRPSLYNDNVHPYTKTYEAPDTHRSWQPFSTTATPSMLGEYQQFYPHEKKCEIGGWHTPRLWEADLNTQIYERSVLSQAKEQPYANWYRRQALAQLININNPGNSDLYTQKVCSPQDSYCNLETTPATVHF